MSLPRARIAHDLKIWPEHFAAVLDGSKRAEVRRCDDRTFAVGDVLRLREWSDESIPHRYDYTGREVSVRVTHVLLGATWRSHPAAVLSFEVIG